MVELFALVLAHKVSYGAMGLGFWCVSPLISTKTSAQVLVPEKANLPVSRGSGDFSPVLQSADRQGLTMRIQGFQSKQLPRENA